MADRAQITWTKICKMIVSRRVECAQELELLEAELQAATREPLSADPFLLYLYGLVLSDRFVNGGLILQGRLFNRASFPV